MAKYVFYVSTGFVGADRKEVVEIMDEELEGKTPQEQEKIIQQEYDIWLSNNAELSWWEAEENDLDDE